MKGSVEQCEPQSRAYGKQILWSLGEAADLQKDSNRANANWGKFPKFWDVSLLGKLLIFPILRNSSFLFNLNQ